MARRISGREIVKQFFNWSIQAGFYSGNKFSSLYTSYTGWLHQIDHDVSIKSGAEPCSTHWDSQPDSTADSTGTRYRYTGPLHYMMYWAVQISQCNWVWELKQIVSLRIFFKHPSQDNYRVFIHPATSNIVTYIMYRVTTLQFFLYSLALRQPGGEVGTAPPGIGLEAAGPRLEWRRTKPGIARVM